MQNLIENDAYNLAIEKAEKIGERFTEPRKLVFQSLINAKGPQKAYDIIDYVSRQSDKTTKPPTVYRALDFLCRIGIVHKIESDSTYSICSHNDHCHKANHSPLFLICKECGEVEEIHLSDIEDSIENAARKKGFALSRIMIEAVGICQHCSQK